MADLSAWPPERLRALDRAVAEARGWTGGRLVKGYVPELWRTPDGTLRSLSAVSLGTGETFVLQEEARIEIHEGIEGWSGMRWDTEGNLVTQADAPTIPISICLAYLAAKGVPFNG